jgi:hypothetical protein
MKVHLMYAERDFRPPPAPRPARGEPASTELTGLPADLAQDLELATLWDAMAGKDTFLREVAQTATLDPLSSIEGIRYRQDVLADCLRHPDVARELYDLAVEAIEAERQVWRTIFAERGEALLHRSTEVITQFLGMLRRLRALAEERASQFESAGFRRFFEQVCHDLGDAYFAEIENHLKALRFKDGVLISARLGVANKGTDYVLRWPRPENRNGLFNRTPLRRPTFSFTIPNQDEAGFQALADLRDQGLNLVAKALGEASDHVLSFFQALRSEVGFYLGVMRLHEALTAIGAPTCTPDPQPCGRTALTAREMSDPCLALQMKRRVTANDLEADGKSLIIVTGANQGGKSTFLRSVGVAQLMMQSGMFVAASGFTAAIVGSVHTHYKREEDDTMTSGKFDEELARMSQIADAIGSGDLLLCNESFAATNEIEGAEIAGEVIRAMTDTGIRIVYVTHMYDLAHRCEQERADTTLFLRADRGEDGQRTYRLREGAPLPTSFGADLYRRTFPEAAAY